MVEVNYPAREKGGGDNDEPFKPGTNLLTPREQARLLLMRSRREVEELRLQQKGKK